MKPDAAEMAKTFSHLLSTLHISTATRRGHLPYGISLFSERNPEPGSHTRMIPASKALSILLSAFELLKREGARKLLPSSVYPNTVCAVFDQRVYHKTR